MFPGGVDLYDRLVHVKKNRLYSPGERPRRFFDSDREICTRLRELCALAKTSPDVCFFCLIFISQDFSENMDHLSPIFFGEKEKKKPPRLRPRNGHIDHVS